MPLLAELVGPYIIPSLTLLTKLPGESCLTPPPPHPYPFGEGRRRGRQHPFIMGFFPPPLTKNPKATFPLPQAPTPKGRGGRGDGDREEEGKGWERDPNLKFGFELDSR